MDTHDIDKFMKMSIGDISQLPIKKLNEFQTVFENMAAKAILARQWLSGALLLKYSPLINEKRETKAQPYGDITIKDQGYVVIESRPLACEWDKTKLKKYADRIRESGGNPEDYMDISYTISEHRYFSLADDVRSSLNEICSLKPGKESITIEKCGGDHD